MSTSWRRVARFARRVRPKDRQPLKTLSWSFRQRRSICRMHRVSVMRCEVALLRQLCKTLCLSRSARREANAVASLPRRSTLLSCGQSRTLRVALAAAGPRLETAFTHILRVGGVGGTLPRSALACTAHAWRARRPRRARDSRACAPAWSVSLASLPLDFPPSQTAAYKAAHE